MPALLTFTRRTLLVVWVALVGLVLILALTAHAAGFLGYRVVIITGSSMNPTIAVGSLVFEQTVPSDEIVAGDIVTLALPKGAVVTHRVVRVGTLDGRPAFETKGDANAAADPVLHPAADTTGVVRFSIPLAGFALAFLGIPSGILSVLSMLGSLLAAFWLLEEIEADRRAGAENPDMVGRGLPA